MKPSTKYMLPCLAAFALLACDLDSVSSNINESSSSSDVSNTEMPVMDSRVISYQKIDSYEWEIKERIITNIDTLKSWFPNDLKDEREECNYFAILNSTSSTGSGYLVLAEDMVLYSLVPNYVGNGCVTTCDIINEAILVCDDKANTLKNNINLNGNYYVVPDWICGDWRTEPEKGFFPIHPRPIMPKPVMDSRVVSYQNVEFERNKIVTNTDTLKLWFPHIFSNGQKSECNYFAMTFEHRNFFYEPAILYKDTLNSEYILSDVRPGNDYGENCKSVIKNEGLVGAFLICDDEAFTLKNIIKPENTPYYWINLSTYLDPNWDCESGIGSPTLEEIFF